MSYSTLKLVVLDICPEIHRVIRGNWLKKQKKYPITAVFKNFGYSDCACYS